ncbi:MAG: YidC/Oxa1 family membrane protein insertase [Lawsonibacter sp.]|nr:YidC/Oxa1 family membrane protein insertase [Lawsonibacter sp.]
MGIILQPFAWLLLFFYNLFNSYGLALILFGIVVKLILFPVTLKSKKSMIQTTMLSGKMQQLQKQYGKDKERYNLEMQKLYEREKVNPMGGCIWSLIPMFVLVALYGIIREPLTYFMQMSGEQIQVLAAQLDWQTLAVTKGWVSQGNMDKLIQGMADKVASGELTVFADGLWKNKDGVISGLFQNGGFNQLYLLAQVTNENLASLQAAVNAQFAGAGEHLFVLNFIFLGIDLSLIPNLMFWNRGFGWDSIGLFLLPLISIAASTLSMKVSQATNKMSNQTKNEQMDRTNKMLMWMMPIMSLWIGFTIPAGLTVYWIAQYLVQMIQEVICGKMLKKDYEAAQEAAAKREAEEKEEEKRRKEEARLERQRRIEEEKKNRGKKKPQKKDTEPSQEGINREDSREGIRAYARGRSYIPGRYGGVTPYTDPNQLFRAIEAAETGKKKKSKSAKAKKGEQTSEEETKPQTVQAPEIPVPPAEPVVPLEQAAPAAETEEIEVEVEEIEVEIDEDENKEG